MVNISFVELGDDIFLKLFKESIGYFVDLVGQNFRDILLFDPNIFFSLGIFVDRQFAIVVFFFELRFSNGELFFSQIQLVFYLQDCQAVIYEE